MSVFNITNFHSNDGIFSRAIVELAPVASVGFPSNPIVGKECYLLNTSPLQGGIQFTVNDVDTVNQTVDVFFATQVEGTKVGLEVYNTRAERFIGIEELSSDGIRFSYTTLADPNDVFPALNMNVLRGGGVWYKFNGDRWEAFSNI